jgi:hypothetical protein
VKTRQEDFRTLILQVAALAVAECSKRGIALTEAARPLLAAAAHVHSMAALPSQTPEEFITNMDALALLGSTAVDDQYMELARKDKPFIAHTSAEVMARVSTLLPAEEMRRLQEQVEGVIGPKSSVMSTYRALADALLERELGETQQADTSEEPASTNVVKFPGNKSLH